MKGVITLKKNKPVKGSFSRFIPRANTGKPCISLFWGSCGEYATLLPRLPKYGRFAPRKITINGLWTAPKMTPSFTPSNTRKGCRNANIKVCFFRRGVKKKGSIGKLV